VGSVILAPGFKPFDPRGLDIYAYDDAIDVVTAMEFERLLSATGPTGGHLWRPSGAKKCETPAKVAWIQCVGSRDLNRTGQPHCSAVCCMYAVKQTIIAREHSSLNLDCAVFYMDLRAQGKDFDRYYSRAKSEGTRFIRARIHSVTRIANSHDLLLRYADERGRIVEEVFHMVVLSTGLVMDGSTAALALRLGIDVDSHNLCLTETKRPTATSIPGIYACGAFTGPKDIPQSVMEASAAACAATEHLAGARHSKTPAVTAVPETDVRRQPPRIGVFVCNCGINIGGVVRVPEVARFAGKLPHVTYAAENLFTCSQDTQDNMVQIIRERKLNRVVVAACTPRTHENLFQETLVNAGLNKSLLEMANIRNHDSWVHADDPDAATQKAKDLVRMAVAKAALLRPSQETELPVNSTALVVGGGIAGMTAAISLSRQGYPVELVEKAQMLGGHARHLYQSTQGEDAGALLTGMIGAIESDPAIKVHLGAHITRVDGFVGNFTTEISANSSPLIISHGVCVLATGAASYRPDEYLYEKHPAVLTHLELDALFKKDDPLLAEMENVVFIQCVGSRDERRPYCSKVCCTHTMQSALSLKSKNPDVNVYVLYRDIRTSGVQEGLYLEARAQGVLFFRYDPDKKPRVSAVGERVEVIFDDPISGYTLSVDADMLCLATAIVSHTDAALAQYFKVPTDSDGWLLEAHQKLRPVDFASDGVFLCGLAHYPKSIAESIAQAKAAAARAVTYLSKDRIMVGDVVAVIDPDRCSGCPGCVQVCPYGAITLNEHQGVAEVNPALCKGCGACAAACPSEVPVLMSFSNQQLYSQIKQALTV
jgi:heterodisulfide reductase subunit A